MRTIEFERTNGRLNIYRNDSQCRTLQRILTMDTHLFTFCSVHKFDT